MNTNLSQVKRQMIILDVLPFVYNLTSIIAFGICFYSESIVLNAIFGFGLLVGIDLMLRSIDNNYCMWHRIPIYNMLMMSTHSILSIIDSSILSDDKYPITYGLFWVWVFSFIVSSIFFLRKRIKKLHKRCT